MKNLLFPFLLFTGFSIQGFSQIEKRTFLLGGNAAVNLSTFNGSMIRINPNIGYFVSKRFCPGAYTSLEFRKNASQLGVSYSFTPFARYYFNVKEKRSFYGLATISLAGVVQFHVQPAYGLGVGHVWFLTKNVGFEAQLLGQNFMHEYGLGANFGLQIYLNRGKKTEEK